jgi:hypothetical protein
MKEKDEIDVVVFGEEVGDNVKGYQRSGDVIWGMTLVFAGVVLFLNTTNVLPWEVWQTIMNFWPLLLIIIGINILLGNNLFARVIVFLLTLTLFFSVFTVVYETENPNFSDNFPESVKIIIDNIKGLVK